MPTYTIRTDDVLDNTAKELLAAPKVMEQYLTRSLPQQIEHDIQPLKTEPPPPDFPFVWSFDPAKQARARAWYFANKVKGAQGGRYRRTHGLAQGWTVETETSGAGVLIMINNPAERAVKWTQSVFQTPSHQRSGWAQYEDTILKAEENAMDSITESWFNLIGKGSLK